MRLVLFYVVPFRSQNAPTQLLGGPQGLLLCLDCKPGAPKIQAMDAVIESRASEPRGGSDQELGGRTAWSDDDEAERREVDEVQDKWHGWKHWGSTGWGQDRPYASSWSSSGWKTRETNGVTPVAAEWRSSESNIWEPRGTAPQPAGKSPGWSSNASDSSSSEHHSWQTKGVTPDAGHKAEDAAKPDGLGSTDAAPKAEDWVPDWLKAEREAANQKLAEVAQQQAFGVFRGPVNPLTVGERKHFALRKIQNDFPRYKPLVPQASSDAVNRLIIAFHCALKWYFQRSGLMNQAKATDARQFASKGQMPGRWIKSFIHLCGDPIGLRPEGQLFWLHSGAAREVLMAEFDVLLQNELLPNHPEWRWKNANTKHIRSGSMPRFAISPSEQLDVVNETLRAFESSMMTDPSLAPSDPGMVAVFTTALNNRRLSC